MTGTNTPDHTDRMVACMLGGAIGDAMGAGVEFMSLAEIRRRFGAAGITGYVPAYGRLGAITDDTQMTLFTTEGMIRSWVRGRSKGIHHAPSVVRHAYLRWLATQHDGGPVPGNPMHDGWLFSVKGLHTRRAPGSTCLAALAAGGAGSVSNPINDSKGCGGVMRAAPAGFPVLPAAQRFRLGCDIAALTHGHPEGYLPAGFLAVAVGALIDGMGMVDALDRAEQALALDAGDSNTLSAVREARAIGRTGVPTPERLELLGGGWVGHEALAIAVACAASTPDFRGGILAAANHSGDSDSTAAIAGNLLGAAKGTAALPPEWRAELELADVIEQLARDAALELRGAPPADEWGEPTEAWLARYPGA